MTQLSVVVRETLGTGSSRTLRREGKIPGVIYGQGKDPISFCIEEAELQKELASPYFFNTVYKVSAGKTTYSIIVKDVQFHPVTDTPLHVDFLQVTDKKPVGVNIPLTPLHADRCQGVKRGGMLNFFKHSVRVLCTPSAIPSSLDYDLSSLSIGHSIKVEDLTLPKGVSLAREEQKRVIVLLVPPKVRGDAAAQEEATAES